MDCQEVMDPKEIALLCADQAYMHKGDDIVILDVDEILVITSYFVVVTGRGRKHLQALCDTITRELRERGVPRWSAEGYSEGSWVLIDLGDVVVQLFDPEARGRYDLESIWADVPRLAWEPPELPESGPDDDDEEIL